MPFLPCVWDRGPAAGGRALGPGRTTGRDVKVAAQREPPKGVRTMDAKKTCRDVARRMKVTRSRAGVKDTPFHQARPRLLPPPRGSARTRRGPGAGAVAPQ